MGGTSLSAELHGAKTIKSSCKLSHGGLTGKLKHGHPGNRLGVEMSAGKWEASYDLKSKDLAVERKWSTGLGELKIKQRVPAGHYELIPSPELQLKGRPVKGKKFSWELQPSYCMQTRIGKVETTMEFGKRTKLKAEYVHKPSARPVLTLSVKPGGSWAKQVSLKASGTRDARLTLEAEPSNKVQLKASVGTQVIQDMRFSAEVKPGKMMGVKPKLTLESKHSAKSHFKPTGVVAGLTLDF